MSLIPRSRSDHATRREGCVHFTNDQARTLRSINHSETIKDGRKFCNATQPTANVGAQLEVRNWMQTSSWCSRSGAVQCSQCSELSCKTQGLFIRPDSLAKIDIACNHTQLCYAWDLTLRPLLSMPNMQSTGRKNYLPHAYTCTATKYSVSHPRKTAAERDFYVQVKLLGRPASIGLTEYRVL